MTDIQARIQMRRGTTTEWATANPVLDEGEFGHDTDTKITKIGDGSTAWSDLEVWLSTERDLVDLAWKSALGRVGLQPVGAPTEVVSHSEIVSAGLTNWPDGLIGTAVDDDTVYAFGPFFRTEIEGSSYTENAVGIDIDGTDGGYAAFGPVLVLDSGRVVAFYHGELFETDPVYAYVGMAYSDDAFDASPTFTNMGTIIQPECDEGLTGRQFVEVGGAPYSISDEGFVYIWHRDTLADGTFVNMAVSRTTLPALDDAAATGTTSPWYKWDGTGWSEPGVSGTPAETAPRGEQIRWCDVAWVESAGAYLMVHSSVNVDGQLYTRWAAKPEGPWSESSPILREPVEGVTFYPTIMRPDPSSRDIVGARSVTVLFHRDPGEALWNENVVESIELYPSTSVPLTDPFEIEFHPVVGNYVSPSVARNVGDMLNLLNVGLHDLDESLLAHQNLEPYNPSPISPPTMFASTLLASTGQSEVAMDGAADLNTASGITLVGTGLTSGNSPTVAYPNPTPPVASARLTQVKLHHVNCSGEFDHAGWVVTLCNATGPLDGDVGVLYEIAPGAIIGAIAGAVVDGTVVLTLDTPLENLAAGDVQLGLTAVPLDAGTPIVPTLTISVPDGKPIEWVWDRNTIQSAIEWIAEDGFVQVADTDYTVKPSDAVVSAAPDAAARTVTLAASGRRLWVCNDGTGEDLIVDPPSGPTYTAAQGERLLLTAVGDGSWYLISRTTAV